MRTLLFNESMCSVSILLVKPTGTQVSEVNGAGFEEGRKPGASPYRGASYDKRLYGFD